MDNKCGRTSTAWFIFLLINVSLQILSVVGDGGQHVAQNMQEKPPLVKMVMDTLTTLKKSHKSSWDKLKAMIHGFQLQFFPPNLDFRGQDQEVDGAGGRMKEAAEKSLEVGKVTAEESAKSAAKVVGEAVHKVKDKISNDEESHQHDEL
ncbi:conserved hypothetical protein [Ricinus communis]|uniref:Uncharacterized protein n=1 Tax=Ricinus communis TaxID=3988 RepID=B9T5U8_RICCO|nr:conserved hypothetical protein [Ricinus communis]|eukprot:XP_002533617.1 uncharacterized protein LOC8276123 [Ricinus communis]